MSQVVAVPLIPRFRDIHPHRVGANFIVQEVNSETMKYISTSPKQRGVDIPMRARTFQFFPGFTTLSLFGERFVGGWDRRDSKRIDLD